MEGKKTSIDLRTIALIIGIIALIAYLILMAWVFVRFGISSSAGEEVIVVTATSEPNADSPTVDLNLSLSNLSFDEIVELISSEDSISINIAYSQESGPFTFLGANNTPQGLEIDLLFEIEKRWFNEHTAFDFKPVPALDRVSSAESGIYDIVVGAVSQTPSRCTADTICTSPAHMVDESAVMILSSSSIDDFVQSNDFCKFFDGNRVGVIVGTTGEGTVPSLFDNCTSKPSVHEYFSRQDVVSGLANNNIAGYFTDSAILRYYAQENGSGIDVVNYKDAIGGVGLENYTFLLNRDRDGLRQLINLTLTAMVCDGTFDTIADRYKSYLSPEFNGITVSEQSCASIDSQPVQIHELITN